PGNWSYWTYSSVSFGDFTEDGLEDMIVGGGSLRISKNIGTKTDPKFGLREFLLDTEGNRLNDNMAGTVPLVVDWDQDGVLDILTTNAYTSSGSAAVLFYRGLNTEDEFRFEPGVPLFEVAGNEKAFPGSWLQTYVTDWNNDGINDLLIGTSVATL